MASYSSPRGGNPDDPRPGSPAGPPPRNGLGIAALVVGLVALALFWTVVGGVVLGLLAIVLGVIGYRRKKRGEATNGAMAIIGLVAGALALVASVVIVAVGVSILNSEEFDSYEECVRNADTVAEREQCAVDFREEFEQR